jgi:hypothetical protein
MEYCNLSDGEIKDFVINFKHRTIQEDIDRHSWYIFWTRLGLSKRFAREDLPGLMEWRRRLIAIKENSKYASKY